MKPTDAPEWMRDRDFEIELLPDKVWGHFLSAGGEGITDSKTGEPVPYVEKAALDIIHRCPNSPTGWQEGCAVFKPHAPNGWDVVSLEPLTLSPSIQCMTATGRDDCPLGHGYVRGGKWVSA